MLNNYGGIWRSLAYRGSIQGMTITTSLSPESLKNILLTLCRGLFSGLEGKKGDANYKFRANANIDIRCNRKKNCKRRCTRALYCLLSVLNCRCELNINVFVHACLYKRLCCHVGAYIFLFYYMELPIYNLLPRSNKKMCGERRREGVVIHR